MIDEVIRFFLDDGRIVGVYEPADPLLNGYNMNLLFESERELWIEVVGPGFDVSDLQRGDLSPHETFSARLSPKGEMSEVKLVQRVDQKAYEESVSLRKNKIRKKLESSPSPELACRVREELAIPEDIETHLKEIGSPLSESQNYRPVSCDVLRDTVNMILDSDVIRRYSDATGVKFPLNFSTSFVHRGSRQVFWDIVSPKLKFGALTKHPEVVS